MATTFLEQTRGEALIDAFCVQSSYLVVTSQINKAYHGVTEHYRARQHRLSMHQLLPCLQASTKTLSAWSV
jgi:hypothetical protein